METPPRGEREEGRGVHPRSQFYRKKKKGGERAFCIGDSRGSERGVWWSGNILAGNWGHGGHYQCIYTLGGKKGGKGGNFCCHVGGRWCPYVVGFMKMSILLLKGGEKRKAAFLKEKLCGWKTYVLSLGRTLYLKYGEKRKFVTYDWMLHRRISLFYTTSRRKGREKKKKGGLHSNLERFGMTFFPEKKKTAIFFNRKKRKRRHHTCSFGYMFGHIHCKKKDILFGGRKKGGQKLPVRLDIP